MRKSVIFEEGKKYRIDGAGAVYIYKGWSMDKGVYLFQLIGGGEVREVPISLPANHLRNIQKTKIND